MKKKISLVTNVCPGYSESDIQFFLCYSTEFVYDLEQLTQVAFSFHLSQW